MENNIIKSHSGGGGVVVAGAHMLMLVGVVDMGA